MKACYFLTWTPDNRNTGIASAPKEISPALEIPDSLTAGAHLPFDFRLTRGQFEDYLGNTLAWPLMSERMKQIIAANLTGKEGVEWVHTKVQTDNESRDYYIPRFTRKLDVLDLSLTTFVAGTDHVMRPYFSIKKVAGFNLFHLPSMFWKITASLYTSDALKNQLTEAGLTGIAFERAALTSAKPSLLSRFTLFGKSR